MEQEALISEKLAAFFNGGDEILEKFTNNAQSVMPAARAEAIRDSIMNIEQIPSARMVSRLPAKQEG